MSDEYLKKDGVQIADIITEKDEIFKLYEKFYKNTSKSGSSIQTGKEIKCIYMEKEIEWAADKIEKYAKQDIKRLKDSTGKKNSTALRFRLLLKQIHKRVDRLGFIGFLEKSATHKIAKSFRTNAVDALTAAGFLAWDVGSIVVDIIFGATGFSFGGLLGESAGQLKLLIDIPILIGTETLSLLVNGKVEFINEKAGGKIGQKEYSEDGKKLEKDMAKKLGDLDEDEAEALFKALARVYKYYLPKINVHFGQCHDAYEAVYPHIFKGDEPVKGKLEDLLKELEKKKQDPNFMPSACAKKTCVKKKTSKNPCDKKTCNTETCDEMIRFAKDVYRLYHEIYKLRQYLMPMLRFMRAITTQAQVWQDDFWVKNKLWETQKLVEIFEQFDKDQHKGCEGTHFCYGPQKIQEEKRLDAKGKEEILQSTPAAHVVGPDIKYPDIFEAHNQMPTLVRTPWWDPTELKLTKRTDTWFSLWKEKKEEKKQKAEEYKQKLENDPSFKKQQEELKKSMREYVLKDKNDRISRFAAAAKKSVKAGDNNAGKRFEALVTDIGLFTEYRGWLGGMWRWATHYFFPVKSKSKTALSICLFAVSVAGGLVITASFAIAEVATAGAATPLLCGIAAGVAAVWGIGKFVTNKVSDVVIDKLEGKYDENALQTGKDWYGAGELSDKKRMRLNRNADASAKVVSHLLSTLKNYKRLKFFRDKGLDNSIKDCDDLAQYLWSVYKLQHHAYKVVDYNRPMSTGAWDTVTTL